jgi:hypothetical protein
MLANFTEETCTIPKATVLGVAEEVSESLIEQTLEPSTTQVAQLSRLEPRKTRRCITNYYMENWTT